MRWTVASTTAPTSRSAMGIHLRDEPSREGHLGTGSSLRQYARGSGAGPGRVGGCGSRVWKQRDRGLSALTESGREWTLLGQAAALDTGDQPELSLMLPLHDKVALLRLADPR